MDALCVLPVEVESWLPNWTFGTCRHSRMPPAARVTASPGWTAGLAGRTRAGRTSPRVMCRLESSTAIRWPRSSARSRWLVSLAACSPESSKNWARSSPRKTSATRRGSTIRGPGRHRRRRTRRLDRGQRGVPDRGRGAADGAFTADVMGETLNRSSLRRARRRQPGQPGARRRAEQPPRRPHRAGPRRRHRATCSRAHRRALGGGADRAAAGARPLRRREGVDHRRRRLAHGVRSVGRRLVRGRR